MFKVFIIIYTMFISFNKSLITYKIKNISQTSEFQKTNSVLLKLTNNKL